MPTRQEEDCLIKACRKILKEKIASKMFVDTLSSEITQLVNVMKRTVDLCESDSALLIGPHGCGKTMLVSKALQQLSSLSSGQEFMVIYLNGLIHTDDNLALKDIIRQLNIETIDNDSFTGSFTDNLQYLLKSFQDSKDRDSKALIFILEEFHLFCLHRNQTLLYNLFDSAQSSKGICIIGVTTHLDVTEMLEKRVKSRFSHRQLLILYQTSIEQRISLFKKLLVLPCDSHTMYLDPVFVHFWNENIEKLCSSDIVRNVLRKQLQLDNNEAKFRSFLMLLISQLTNEHSSLEPEDVNIVYQNFTLDDKVAILQGLSVLEITLIIAMSHQTEIFDGEPFNFEMIIGRYLKFANQNSAIHITQRPVIFKAFERIKVSSM
ncbi:origin recognition complex subunit 4 isoform X2 [Lycorma delicatula]|uniref:origin recognition complex subunit 4 isoform X2 n=1 Tax=Lycorma delicatula TaxID=130591 RepID=UPI003F50F1A1